MKDLTGNTSSNSSSEKAVKEQDKTKVESSDEEIIVSTNK